MKLVGWVLLILLAACGGTPSSSAATASASASASASSDGAVGSLCAEGHTPCPLEPGTYSAAPFEPGFTFTIEDEWTNDRAYADGGGISQAMGGIYWASGVSAGRVNDEEVEIGPAPGDFVAYLQTLSALGATVSAPTPVTVDGVAGQQVDVATNEVGLPGLYLVAEDAFNLVPDEKARFLVLDMNGETVLIVVDAFTTADFDAWVETAQPVIDSIRWE